MEQFTTDRAHLIAVKDNEIGNLRQEVEKLLNDAKNGGSSIAELKKKIFNLEQDKAELLMLKVGYFFQIGGSHSAIFDWDSPKYSVKIVYAITD